MRLLVTGASGFIGKNLLLKIPREWETVATYHKSIDFPAFLTDNALDNIEAISVDLSDGLATRKKVKGPFDCAIHLAANTDVSLSLQDPEADLRFNAVTLFNTVKTAKIRNLVFMSSGAVYDGSSGLVSPGSRLNPSLPYAISKLACEHYVSHFKKHRLIENYIILRFFGAYGPHEPPRKIFSRLVKAFYFEGKRVFTIVGDGDNFIDAMYVEDAVEGMIKVVESDVRNITVDFASGSPMTINNLVTRVAEIFQKKNIKLKREGFPAEYITFYSSGKDMEAFFGFKPSVSLEVGIWKLAKWLEKRCA